MAEKYPGVDLNVFVDALSYPDNPNHESGMPNFLKASDRYKHLRQPVPERTARSTSTAELAS